MHVWPVREPGAAGHETFLVCARNHGETNNIHAAIHPIGRRIMWWILLIGVLLLSGQLVDTIEDWRASRSARKDLFRMRQHEAVGHRWDCARGQWQV
jgi:hypothetical protein